MTKPGVVIGQAHLYFPSFLRQRNKTILLDDWIHGRQQDIPQRSDNLQGDVYSPRNTSPEYRDLASRSPRPWAGLVVTSLAQTLYVDGIARPDSTEKLQVWHLMQQNRFDSTQLALHRAAVGHGLAYGVSLPATDPLTGGRSADMRGKSAKRMAAWYADAADEWPILAIEADPVDDGTAMQVGWTVRLYDEQDVHYLSCKGDGLERSDWTYIEARPHGTGVPPVVRFANRVDLDGYTIGEVEPVIPLLRSIDQDTFDRLIVQRFGAWKVRYIAGLAKPEGGADAEAAVAVKLSQADFLAVGDNQAKFGTLDATDIKGFIEAGDADLRVLAAITQTPPHHLLGLSSNLQAEALAAAEAGLQRKSGDFRMLNGENHEQWARLAAHQAGLDAEARAFDMQVRWRDTESRSFAQAVQALGVVATQLQVPLEMVWERMPGWTDADSERAKALVQDGTLEKLLAALAEETAPEPQEPAGGNGNANAA